MQRGEEKRREEKKRDSFMTVTISFYSLQSLRLHERRIITILAPALDYVMSSSLNYFLLNFLSISSFGALGPYRTGVSYKLDNDKVSFISALY